MPKEFEKTTEVLPFPKYGLSSVEEFRKAEEEVHHHEWLKKAGLTSEEIKLYQENEAGLLDQRKKIESGALKDKLEDIYNKINNAHNQNKRYVFHKYLTMKHHVSNFYTACLLCDCVFLYFYCISVFVIIIILNNLFCSNDTILDHAIIL